MLLSFLFDIPIFLPVLGAVIFWRAAKKKRRINVWRLSLFTLACFWLVSGGLYFDLWGKGGNHFMWYSWLDTLGVVKPGWIPTPTYLDPKGFWHLFGFFLFATYPFFLLVVGRRYFRLFKWLKGIMFGHIKGQTGLWGLLTNK